MTRYKSNDSIETFQTDRLKNFFFNAQETQDGCRSGGCLSIDRRMHSIGQAVDTDNYDVILLCRSTSCVLSTDQRRGMQMFEI